MVQIELQTDVEARLAAEAHSCGLTLGEYIQQIVASHVYDPDEVEFARDLKQGLSEIAEGNTLPARAVFVQLREEHDIRG